MASRLLLFISQLISIPNKSPPITKNRGRLPALKLHLDNRKLYQEPARQGKKHQIRLILKKKQVAKSNLFLILKISGLKSDSKDLQERRNNNIKKEYAKQQAEQV